MRNLTRIVVAFVLSLLVTLTCFGQKSRGTKRGPAKPRPRPTPEKEEFPSGIVIAPVTRAAGSGEPDEVREVGNATVSYYRKRDETSVFIKGEVYREAPVLIWLSFDITVKGKEVVRPEVVVANASSNVAAFNEGVGLIIEADGKRFDFKPEPETCVERKCVNLHARVDFATFEQIAKSQSIKVRAAPYWFDLNAGASEALGDMLRAIESPPKNP
jgi:hypothetical protein